MSSCHTLSFSRLHTRPLLALTRCHIVSKCHYLSCSCTTHILSQRRPVSCAPSHEFKLYRIIRNYKCSDWSYVRYSYLRQHLRHIQHNVASVHTPASFYSTPARCGRKRTVLGIETSCDDTGAAVVDEDGNVIGEALNSQTSTHNLTGGIVPNIAKDLHSRNVGMVVKEALDTANMSIQEVDAIAVTVEPGLIMSLRVGLRHAEHLVNVSRLPLIPIHHMEAHALTARMIHTVEFPFLVLLASGGHCLLAVAKDVDKFELLGYSLDTAPGEAYDKTARELGLFHHPEFKGLSGGVAVERLAEKGNPEAFPRVHVMPTVANCNFSFTGLKISACRIILAEYERLGIPKEEMLSNAADICAWFQHNVVYHLARRLQRAFIFSEMWGPKCDKRTLVLSGGVAANSYIRSHLSQVCTNHGYTLICPPQKLCTDNGIMIAWNGMEKLLSGRDFSQDPQAVDVKARSPLGIDISKDVSQSSIKLPKLVFVRK